MTPALFLLLPLLLLPLLFLMGRKGYGKSQPAGPTGGKGEGEPQVGNGGSGTPRP